MSDKYVVYWCEQLRDGNEEGAKIFSSLDESLKCIQRLSEGYAGGNIDLRLFLLGKEILLIEEETEEPQPSVKKTVYKVKGSRK